MADRDGTVTSLVAGGAGFVGSHLCEELLARGDRVIAV
ncbi:MAG: NAD-dependent epimerase/dehydratase family protein, partial [Deltaproteobacteria bacterium]|nr:NAD-dependent epimerase/dehydratase family protein [Deltaproteobacteria bacterium]